MFLSNLFYSQDFRSIKFLFMTLLIILNSVSAYAEGVTSNSSAANVVDSTSTGRSGINLSNIDNEGNLSLQFCNHAVASSFKTTKIKYEQLKKLENSFESGDCSISFIDLFMKSNISDTCTAQSGEKISECQKTKGVSGVQSATKVLSDCRTIKNEIETRNNEVLKAKEQEKAACISQATSLRNTGLQNPSQDCEELSIRNDYITNVKSCNTAAQEVQTKSEKLLSFAKEHWITITGLLTAVGGGAYWLAKSGKKQAEDLTTNPTAAPTDSKNAAAPPPAPIATPEANVEVSPTFQRPSDQAYCQNSIRPVECFVTPSCDLACAANRYGVENYSGMGNDTRMIDKNGKIVDPTTARPRNPGATAASNAEGGSSSSKSGSGPGEVSNRNPETAANEPINTRSAHNFNYDDSGFGSGRGFGNDSYNMDREPAAARNFAQLQNVQTKDLAAAATGPVLQSKENIFNQIYEASRAQCVRDLVYCDGK